MVVFIFLHDFIGTESITWLNILGLPAMHKINSHNGSNIKKRSSLVGFLVDHATGIVLG